MHYDTIVELHAGSETMSSQEMSVEAADAKNDEYAHHFSYAQIWGLSMIGVFAALVGFLIAWAKYRNGPGTTVVTRRNQWLVRRLDGRNFDRVHQDVFVRGFAVLGCVWSITSNAVALVPLIAGGLLNGFERSARRSQPARVATGISLLAAVLIAAWVLCDVLLVKAGAKLFSLICAPLFAAVLVLTQGRDNEVVAGRLSAVVSLVDSWLWNCCCIG